MNAPIRTTAAGVLAAGVLLLGSGSASADTDPNFEPGPDYTNFQPGPDYTNFDPEPDQTPFEPGYAPGTADLVDDTVAALLRGLFG